MVTTISAYADAKSLISEIEFLAEDAYDLAKKSSESDNLEQAHMYARLAMKSAESAKNAAEAALAEYAEPNKRADDIPFLE